MLPKYIIYGILNIKYSTLNTVYKKCLYRNGPNMVAVIFMTGTKYACNHGQKGTKYACNDRTFRKIRPEIIVR